MRFDAPLMGNRQLCLVTITQRRLKDSDRCTLRTLNLPTQVIISVLSVIAATHAGKLSHRSAPHKRSTKATIMRHASFARTIRDDSHEHLGGVRAKLLPKWVPSVAVLRVPSRHWTRTSSAVSEESTPRARPRSRIRCSSSNAGRLQVPGNNYNAGNERAQRWLIPPANHPLIPQPRFASVSRPPLCS